jgi:dUTP pyrophosphatase
MKILKVRDVKTPNRGTPQSAGLDFYIPNDYPKTVLLPNQSVLIPSGIKANVPAGFALIAFNKSGIAVKKQLLVGACVIDEDYMGEIHIDLKNVGTDTVELNPGDKVIQILCVPIEYVEVEEVSNILELFNGEVTERGTGGFGSTGTK